MTNTLFIEKIKKNPEPFIFTTLFIFLVITLFFLPMSIITTFFLIFASFMVKSETIIALYLFSYPFTYLFALPNLNMTWFLFFMMGIALIKNYICDLVKKRRVLNFKNSQNSFMVLTIFIAMNIYLLLPFHNHNGAYLLLIYSHMIPSFFAYIYRKTLNIKKLVYIFSISMILSGIFFFFRNYSELLSPLGCWTYNSYVRMLGCLDHPNIYAFNTLIVLGSLAILYLKNSINPCHFIILFMTNFTFGYLTLSRLYILSVFVFLVIFFVCLIVKEKIYAFNLIFAMVAMLALIVLIFDEVTTNYVVRANDMYESGFQEKLDSLTPEDWELIYSGEKHFDPGRFGIWKIYITYLIKNPFILIFGRGTNIQLGVSHAHNLLLNSIYWHGILGVILYFTYAYYMLGGKKIFKNKNSKYLLILLIPIFIFQFAEKIYDVSIFYWLLMYNLQENKLDVSEDYGKMNYMLNQNKPYKFNCIFNKKKEKTYDKF